MRVQEVTWKKCWQKKAKHQKKWIFSIKKKLLYKFYEALSGQVALAMSRFLMILFFKVHTSP